MNLFGGNNNGDCDWIWIIAIVILILCICGDGSILGGSNKKECCPPPCKPICEC